MRRFDVSADGVFVLIMAATLDDDWVPIARLTQIEASQIGRKLWNASRDQSKRCCDHEAGEICAEALTGGLVERGDEDGS